MITYSAENIQMPKIKKRQINRWIKIIAGLHDKKIGDIGYLFVDDNKILETNKQYLKHDYYTDIITFDYTENNTINGDIIISLDTVESNAEAFGKTFINELHRVIIHGILHLCGINDKSPKERKQMEAWENKSLRILKEILADIKV